MNLQYTDIDALARKLSESTPFSFLVGAGISYSSGVPTGEQLTQQVMAEIYQREHNERAQNNDMNTNVEQALAREWILKQEWYDQNESDYSNVLQRRYPTPDLRAKFFQGLIGNKQPCESHYSLAALMASRVIRANICLTPNFDPFVEYALIRTMGKFPIVSYHEDDLDLSILTSREPIVLKLHGDFLYENLANLDEEVRFRLRGKMATKIENSVRERGLIVIGYGGHDASIMSILSNCATTPKCFSHGVYWILREGSKLSESALTFMEKVHEKDAYIMETKNADEFLSNLTKACGEFKPKNDVRADNIIQLKAQMLQECAGELDSCGYVSPMLTKVEKGQSDQSTSHRFTADELCKRFSKDKGLYVVTGPGGIGKTLFLKYAALNLCKTTDNIPLLIDLRTVTDENLSEYLNTNFMSQQLDSLIAQGKLILLCDALDQCQNPRKRLEDLMGFAYNFSKVGNRLLVATRNEVLKNVPLENIFEISLFDLNQTSDVVKRNLGESAADQFLTIANSDDTLRKLLQEPLTLSLAISIFKQFGRIPGNRNEVFDRYILLVLGGWQSSRLQTGSVAFLRDVLTQIAYSVYRVNSIASLSSVEACIRDQLKAEPVSKQEEANEVLRRLIGNELMTVKGDQVEFRHEEFRWYCVATWIYKNMNISDALKELKNESRLLDAMYYLSGMIDDSTELVSGLLKLAGNDYYDSGEFLSSVRAIGNAKSLSEDIYKAVIRHTINFESIEVQTYLRPLAQNNSDLATIYLEKMVVDSEGTDRTRAVAANVLGYIGTKKALESLINLSKHNDDLVRMRSLVGFRNFIETFGAQSIERNDEALVRIASSAADDSGDVRFWSSFLFRQLCKEVSSSKDTVSSYNFFLYAFEGKPGEWPDKCRSAAQKTVKEAIAKLTSFALGKGSGGWKFRAFCAVALLEIYDIYPTDITLSFVQFVLRGGDDFFVMKAIEILMQMDRKLAARELCSGLEQVKGNNFQEDYSRWSVAVALGILEEKEGVSGLIILVNDIADHVAMQAHESLSRLAILYPEHTKYLVATYINQHESEKCHRLKDLANTIEAWEAKREVVPSLDVMRQQDIELFKSNNLMWYLRTGSLSNKESKA